MYDDYFAFFYVITILFNLADNGKDSAQLAGQSLISLSLKSNLVLVTKALRFLLIPLFVLSSVHSESASTTSPIAYGMDSEPPFSPSNMSKDGPASASLVARTSSQESSNGTTQRKVKKKLR